MYLSKIQCSIEIGTYSTEFSETTTGVEEVLCVRVMLREIGFNINIYRIFCNNATVVTSITNMQGLLKK